MKGRLTPSNWLEPDEQAEAFARLGSTPADPAELAADFLGIDISTRVPRELAERFAAARAALVYGSLFYPLYSLGVREMARIALEAFEDVRSERKRSGVTHSEVEDAFWSQLPQLADGTFLRHQRLTPDEIHDIVKRLAHAISSLYDPDIDFLAAWTRRK